MSDSQTWIDRSRPAAAEEQRMLILARERISELEEKVEQLERALTSRIIIEQANGTLGERLAIGVDEAFDLLRYAARSHRQKLHDIAARVINERNTPAPVVVAMAKSQRARAAWMRELAEAHVARVNELHAALDEQTLRVQKQRQEDL
jgi:hypothetical protein